MKQLHLLLPGPLAAEPESDRTLAPAIVAAYQVLWHPALLCDAEQVPSIRDIDNLPSGPDLVLSVPKACHDKADERIRRDLSELGAKVVLVGDETGLIGPVRLAEQLGLRVDPAELLLDFYAVGYAYLGLTIVLRRLGHRDKLDETLFWAELHQAAAAFVNGDTDAARDALHAAIDVLHGNRQAAYPATINWIDVALLPPGGAKGAILERLGNSCRWNLIASASEVESWDEELRSAVQERWNDGGLEVLGGVRTSRPLSVLPFESRVWEFCEGARLYKEALGRDVDSFGSRTAALFPNLPQLLMKFGFRYALHASFDGSRFPIVRGPKIHWTSVDGSVVEALARTAVNAGDETMALAVFEQLARVLESDRSATMALAHLIHAPSAWYQWLLRVERQGDVFGKFESFGEYFLHASLPEGPTRTRAEEYDAGPTVASIAVEDGGHSLVRHHRERSRLDAARSLAALCQVVSGSVESDGSDIADDLEVGRDIASRLEGFEKETARRLADAVLRGAPPGAGYLLINACNFPRRVGLELEGMPGRVAVEKPLRAFEWGEQRSSVLVDVPGWGFAWIPRHEGTAPAGEPLAPVASGRRLRNTLIEIEIDKHSGGIRGSWMLRDGYSRIGQQIVHSSGSRMACRNIAITGRGTVFGEITTTGDILDAKGKRVLAEFRQTVRLWRGKQQATIEIAIDPKAESKGTGRDEYYACRWAWPDEKTTVYSCGGFARNAHQGAEIEAAEFLEIHEARFATNIVCPGLIHHRRTDYRMLDSLLPDMGERPQCYRFTVGFDMVNPWQLLLDATWPTAVVPVENGPPVVGPTGWLANISGEDIVAASLSPILGEKKGVRLRLAETGGAAVRGKLRFARKQDSSRLANFKGELLYDLHDEDDAVPVDFSALEMHQVEVFLP